MSTSALKVFVCATGLLLSANLASAQFTISDATGPFEVSFRNLANTTYFGWTLGSFDADPTIESPSSEILTTPAITVGTSIPGIGLNLIGTSPDILASSNNIYNGSGANSNAASFQIDIPTSGTVNSGFTTIIIQGNGTSGGPAGTGTTNTPVFGSINGVAPTFVAGANANGALQFWAKYEISGNATSYSAIVNLLGGIGVTPTSIADLRIDTQWSATGFASDFAAVPEPATWGGITALALLFFIYQRRRQQQA